jgi:hypothetical protein
VSKFKARVARLIADVDPPRYQLAQSSCNQYAAMRLRRRPLNELDRAWTQMLHSVAEWSLMVTFTFRRQSAKKFRVTQQAIENALRRLLRLVNHDLFGKRLTNKGWTVAHAVVVGFGTSGDHPHAHLLLKAPRGFTDEELCRVIERAARRTRIIDQHRDYRQYYSAGGAEYLIGHGTDRMVVSLLTPAHQGD